jgi:hypothetical protein
VNIFGAAFLMAISLGAFLTVFFAVFAGGAFTAIFFRAVFFNLAFVGTTGHASPPTAGAPSVHQFGAVVVAEDNGVEVLAAGVYPPITNACSWLTRILCQAPERWPRS